MEKQISMIIDETKAGLISTINNSKLPMCILELMVKDIYQEIRVLAENQLKRDKEMYDLFLIEKEKESNSLDKEDNEPSE